MTPDEYIEQLDEPRRSQIRELHELIQATVPELAPHVQSGMLGYGSYHYVYASGREGDWPILGLASRKRYISLYACAAVDGEVAEQYRAACRKPTSARAASASAARRSRSGHAEGVDPKDRRGPYLT